MWIKVEDPKIKITESLSLSSYNQTDGTVTVTASTGGYFPNGAPGWNVAQGDILEFAVLDEKTLLPMKNKSIFIKSTGTIGTGTTAAFKVEWVKAANIKTVYRNGLTDYYPMAIRELEDIVAGTVGTDYQVYKLAQGMYHTHHTIQTSYILGIVDGRKEAFLNNEDMFLATCCSYAPGAEDSTSYNAASGETPAAGTTANYLSTNLNSVYGTGKRRATDSGGNLGPFFNQTDELCELFLYGGPSASKHTIANETQRVPRKNDTFYGDNNSNTGGGGGDPRNPTGPTRDPGGPRETDVAGDKYVTKYKPRVPRRSDNDIR